MITQMLICPHCAAGFGTHDELHTHGREAHRDSSPKEHEQLDCEYCKVEYGQRTVRDEHDAENLRIATQRLDEQTPAGD